MRTGDGSRKLTQDDCPKLPGAELWHPECQQQTAGAVPGWESIREGWDQFPDVLSCLPLAMPLDSWAPPKSHAVKFPHQLINACVKGHRNYRPTGCKSAQPPWLHSPFPILCPWGLQKGDPRSLPFPVPCFSHLSLLTDQGKGEGWSPSLAFFIWCNEAGAAVRIVICKWQALCN